MHDAKTVTSSQAAPDNAEAHEQFNAAIVRRFLDEHDDPLVDLPKAWIYEAIRAALQRADERAAKLRELIRDKKIVMDDERYVFAAEVERIMGWSTESGK